MRWGLLVAAIGVIVVSLALIAYTQLTVSAVPIPADPSGEIIGGLHVLGTQTATVHWWGGVPATVVHFFVCSNPTCHGPNGTTEVSRGSGAAGALEATVTSTGIYEINTSGGPPVNGSVQLSGITSLTLIGLILLATGGVLAVWSLRRSRSR
ncbi:MAG: hypothetical protein ACREDK_02400 [Thermoplasmata archaeon]